MSLEGTLNGWLELTDSSSILRAVEINRRLQELCRGDDNAECEGIVWNEDFTVPLHMSITYWDGIPPAWEELLDQLIDDLQPGEYMVFDEKLRASLGRGWSNRTLVVSRAGVRYLTSEESATRLMEQADLTPAEPTQELDVEVQPKVVSDPLDL